MTLRPWSDSLVGRNLKALNILLALVVTVGATAAEVRDAPAQPTCAFGDGEMMTSLGICTLVAKHFVAQKVWPTELDQIRQQALRLTGADEAAEFLARFSLIEMHRVGTNLSLHFRFKIGEKDTEHRVICYTRATVDDILQAMTGYE